MKQTTFYCIGVDTVDSKIYVDIAYLSESTFIFK